MLPEGLLLAASAALDAAAVAESITALGRHRLRGRYELTTLLLYTCFYRYELTSPLRVFL